MVPMRLRLIVIVITLAVAVLLGYGAFWWIAAERFQSAALAWIEARKAEGYGVGYAALTRDGFPIRLRLEFRDPSLASRGGIAPWSWSGARVVAEIAPWAPLHVTLRTDGPQTVALPGRRGPLVYTGRAATVSASIAADRALPVRTVTIRDLTLTGRESTDVIAAGHVEMDLRRGANGAGLGLDGGYDLSVAASDLRLPADLRFPLGERVEYLALDAKVIGDPHARPWPEGALAWRDAGGVVEVAALDVRYGPLRLAGAGTLALDAGGQLMGTLNARGEGLSETLDVLDQRGLLKGIGVASAKLVLRILSRPSATGEPGLNVPLTLRDRILSAASLPLLEVPAIVWPPGALPAPR